MVFSKPVLVMRASRAQAEMVQHGLPRCCLHREGSVGGSSPSLGLGTLETGGASLLPQYEQLSVLPSAGPVLFVACAGLTLAGSKVFS